MGTSATMHEMEERRYSKCRTRSACSHASDYFLELAVYSLFALSEVKERTEGLPVLMLRWKVVVIEMTKERARLLSTVGDRQIVSARRADCGGRGLVDRHGALSAQMRQPGKPELPESPSTCRVFLHNHRWMPSEFLCQTQKSSRMFSRPYTGLLVWHSAQE